MICVFCVGVKLWKNHTQFTDSSKRVALDLRSNVQRFDSGERLLEFVVQLVQIFRFRSEKQQEQSLVPGESFRRFRDEAE